MRSVIQWTSVCVAAIVLVGAYIYVDKAIDAQQNQVRKARPTPPEQAVQITVMKASAGTYAASIQASGLVSPRYELTLSNQVSGEVDYLSDVFEAGQIVPKGHLLASLTNPQLDSDLASAKNTLASARLALKEEQRQGAQAKAEWDAAGFQDAPDSDLVLREPQLAVAQAEVDAALAALDNAQQDLQHTNIQAPFNALVVSREVALGSYLSANTEVATLYSTDRAEIVLDLSNSDWLKLPDESSLLADWPVTVQSIDTQAQWQGKVLRVGKHIDEETRMRSLTVSVDHPFEQSPNLLPGSFVTVSLQGKKIPSLWRLPSTALSQKSEIWYLDKDSRLAAFETTPRFVDKNYVYIDFPQAMQEDSYMVLVNPYNSYVQGTLVDPIIKREKGSKGSQP